MSRSLVVRAMDRARPYLVLAKPLLAAAMALSMPLAASAQSVVCHFDSAGGQPRSYAEAVGDFEMYIEGMEKGIDSHGSLPFILLHDGKTANAALLIHGLTDSPYSVQALGLALYQMGYNVVAILLPGHGTSHICLDQVTAQDWEGAVSFGLGVARQLGDKVSLLGFSTGGALALDAVRKNYAGAGGAAIGNLILVSPALGFSMGLTLEGDVLSRLPLPIAEGVAGRTKMPARSDEGATKYQDNTTNAKAQLFDLVNDNKSAMGEIQSDISSHGLKVFAVESMADTTVSPSAVCGFMHPLLGDQDDCRPGGNTATYIADNGELVLYDKSAGIKHADVPRPETNPQYPQLVGALFHFLADNGDASGQPSAPGSADQIQRQIDQLGPQVLRQPPPKQIDLDLSKVGFGDN